MVLIARCVAPHTLLDIGDSVMNVSHYDTAIIVSNRPFRAWLGRFVYGLPRVWLDFCARFLLRLPRVKIDSEAAVIRQVVQDAPVESWLRRRDFTGSDRAVETAMSRIAANGELLRIRKGLYWKGRQTRFGITRPTPLQTALEVAGEGSGPAGVAAAAALGLTTQVPSVVEVAIPGRIPAPIAGIRFRSRSYLRRDHHLKPIEVAVLEMLRTESVVEESDALIVKVLKKLIRRGEVRRDVLTKIIHDESARSVRQAWDELLPALS